IKPENIIVRHDGLVKVLDFGLAKRTAPIPAGTALATRPVSFETAPGMIMGTIGYMSPEQIRGLEVGATTDIFSFGIVLYEMVSGVRAFSGTTPSDMMVAVLQTDPKPLMAVDPDIPAALDRVIMTCLAKEPGERWQSAKDLARELKWISTSHSSV